MRVCVLSLTRDRLAYSQHCFESLRQNAGCDYDHFVLDNGSTDGTQRWLLNGVYAGLDILPKNVGISVGMNKLLDRAGDGYDVYVKFDNDCEVVTLGTLGVVSRLVVNTGWILGPQISGIGTSLRLFDQVPCGEYTLARVEQIPGCFLAAPAALYREFRYSESNPTWGEDDLEVCHLWRRQGHHVGQVLGYEASHYETTAGQEARYPEYFKGKVREGMPWV